MQVFRHYAKHLCEIQLRIVCKLIVRKTLQEEWAFKSTPKQKWQFQHFCWVNWPPKKFDFSYKPMRMPIIVFWGLEMMKKGVSIAFLLSVVTNSGS